MRDDIQCWWAEQTGTICPKWELEEAKWDCEYWEGGVWDDASATC